MRAARCQIARDDLNCPRAYVTPARCPGEESLAYARACVYSKKSILDHLAGVTHAREREGWYPSHATCAT